MNNSGRTLALAQLAVRHFSKTAVKQSEVPSRNFPRLKRLQEKFGVEDGVPVFLKGGVADRLLYRLTLGLTLGGLGYTFFTFYEFAQK